MRDEIEHLLSEVSRRPDDADLLQRLGKAYIEQRDYTAARFNNQAITRAYAQTADAKRSTLRILNSLAMEDCESVAVMLENGDGSGNEHGNRKAPICIPIPTPGSGEASHA